MRRWLALALLLVSAPVVAQTSDWRRLASDADRARLRDRRAHWTQALAAAQLHGASRIALDQALFDPDRALADPIPPIGRYRCRLQRLFASRAAVPVVENWRSCRIEQDKALHRFVVEGGEQRPVGMIYPDTGARAVFLGTLAIGDERRAMRYGRDRLRDVAGVVERIGERRWRLTIPAPSFGSTLDIIELTPG